MFYLTAVVTPLISAMEKQKQVGLCGLKTSLVCSKFQDSQGYIIRPGLKTKRVLFCVLNKTYRKLGLD